MSWGTINAGELIVKRGGSVNPSKFPDETFDLYSIPAFDEGKHEILTGKEIGSSKSIIQKGDVLLSKIIPHIRRCQVVPKRKTNRQIGSGEWIIFRSDRHHPNFLRHFLTSNIFHQQFMRTVAGVGGSLVRARPAAVASIEVPIPPLIEQRRIASILDKADSLRRKREKAITLTNDLLRSVFLDMFGDPGTNPNKLEVTSFESLLKMPLRNGISPSSNGTVSADVLILSAITGSFFDASQKKSGFFEKSHSDNDQVNVNDFYICRGNGSPKLVGRGFFANASMPGVAFPDTMIAARPAEHKILRPYLEAVWNSRFVRDQIVKSARTTNGTYKINQTAVRNVSFPLAPLEKQRKFAVISEGIHSSNKNIRSLHHLDLLFSSLSDRAFSDGSSRKNKVAA